MGRCLTGAFCFSEGNDLYQSMGAPVWGVVPRRAFVRQENDFFQRRELRCGPLPRRGVFFSKNDHFSYLDTTFLVNVPKSQCLPSTYSLSEFIRGIRGIHGITGIRGNVTNRAGLDLCSTRAWGKDGGS